MTHCDQSFHCEEKIEEIRIMSEEEKMTDEEMKETEKPTEEEEQEESEVPSWASLGLDSRILAGLGSFLSKIF